MKLFIIWATSVAFFMLAIIAYRFRGNMIAAFNYFRDTEPGRNAAVGVVIFTLALAVLGGAAIFASSKAHGQEYRATIDYFVYTEIYGGIDVPLSQSVQCLNDGIDNKITSNGGVKQNIFEYRPSRYMVISGAGKWTHHSCAFNSDRNTYDAPGLELGARIYW